MSVRLQKKNSRMLRPLWGRFPARPIRLPTPLVISSHRRQSTAPESFSLPRWPSTITPFPFRLLGAMMTGATHQIPHIAHAVTFSPVLTSGRIQPLLQEFITSFQAQHKDGPAIELRTAGFNDLFVCVAKGDAHLLIEVSTHDGESYVRMIRWWVRSDGGSRATLLGSSPLVDVTEAELRQRVSHTIDVSLQERTDLPGGQ